MSKSNEIYKKSGVDIEAGYKSLDLIKEHVQKTLTPECLGGIGGFSGMFAPNLKGMSQPVLVSGTDGVGTKLKIAYLMDKHDTIGIDCVAMCINDIVCVGAKPLFFLDYIACGKNYPQKISSIVKGIASGCKQANCALIGGETAEHPGLMPNSEYDLAGFCVGIVDKSRILKTNTQKQGDVLIALPSSGVHSNGFSLIRKVFNVEHADLDSDFGVLNQGLGLELLTPTAIYAKPLLSLIDKVDVKSIAHITGGGFYENIPRALNKSLGAKIIKSSIKTPTIFNLIQKVGDISEFEMFNTFNMGVGACCCVDKKSADLAIDILNKEGIKAYVIGELVTGEHDVFLV